MATVKKIFFIFFLLGLPLNIQNCDRNNSGITRVNAELDAATSDIIDSDNIIWLENSEDAFIYDISNLIIIEERWIIQSRTLWKIFTPQGQYIGEVAHKGEAPEDFAWMGNIWRQDSMIFMFDHSLRKIQKYTKDGTYLGYDTIAYGKQGEYDISPEEVYITDDDGVFYINGFLGTSNHSKLACHAANPQERPAPVGERRRLDGHTFYNRAFVDNANHRLLYWEHIKDTLFTITKEDVKPLVFFDYGKNKVPEEISSKTEVYQRFEALHELGDNEYAYPMRYFQVHDGLIYFLVPKGKHGYIGCYDENKQKVEFTEFVSEKGKRILPQLFFKIEGNDVYLAVIDEDNIQSNPGLYKFDISRIKKP